MGPNLSADRPIELLVHEEVVHTATSHLDNYLGMLATCRSVRGLDLAMKTDAVVDMARSLADSGLPLGDYVHSSAVMLGLAAGTIYIRPSRAHSAKLEYLQATDAGIKMLAICNLDVPRGTLEQLSKSNQESLWEIRQAMMPETAQFASIERQWGIPMTAAEKLIFKINARLAKMRYGGNKVFNGILIGSYQDRLNAISSS